MNKTPNKVSNLIIIIIIEPSFHAPILVIASPFSFLKIITGQSQ